MSRVELHLAVVSVWLILSVGILFILLTPFVVPDRIIDTAIPQCECKRIGKTCPLCGMTTAFRLISRGDVKAAMDANPHSVWLYACFVLNECFLLVALTSWAYRRRRVRGHAVAAGALTALSTHGVGGDHG
jgi:hypothetical protein